MTRVALPGLRAGWRGGQHLSVRLFFVPPPLEHGPGTSRARRLVRDTAHALRCAVRPFEAHPLSISCAPAELAADARAGERGVELYARSCGPRTWSDDLHRHVAASAALAAATRSVRGSAARTIRGSAPQQGQLQQRAQAQRSAPVRMLCLVEGPYGGLHAFSPLGLLEETESLMLVAGGSGMSFVLGVLDELVGRRLRGEGGARGGRVDVVWVVRQRALVAWFAERLRAVLGAAEGSPLRVVLKVYVTCDDALTTAVEGSAGSSSSSSPSSSAGAAATPPFPPPPLLPELATLSYSRPSLHTLVHDALDRALAPCGTCYPVCRCGELAGAGGECANDEEECIGGCGGVSSARELLERREDDEEEKGGEDKEEGGEVVPTLARQGGCCGSKGAGARVPGVDEIVELPSAVPSSCCAPPRPSSAPALQGARTSPSCGGCCARTTGGGCCTGVTEGPESAAEVDADERDRVEGSPLRVRTGGMGFVVCGPGNMVVRLAFSPPPLFHLSLRSSGPGSPTSPSRTDPLPLGARRPSSATPSPPSRSLRRCASAASPCTSSSTACEAVGRAGAMGEHEGQEERAAWEGHGLCRWSARLQWSRLAPNDACECTSDCLESSRCGPDRRERAVALRSVGRLGAYASRTDPLSLSCFCSQLRLSEAANTR